MKNKNTWICILFILAGLVIGGLIGQLTSGVDFLWWLSYGQEFGLSANSPLVLIGVIISIFIYRKAL